MLRARRHGRRVRVPPRLRLVRSASRDRRPAALLHGDLLDAIPPPGGRRRPRRGGRPGRHPHRSLSRVRTQRRAGPRQPADLLLGRRRRPAGDAVGVGQPGGGPRPARRAGRSRGRRRHPRRHRPGAADPRRAGLHAGGDRRLSRTAPAAPTPGGPQCSSAAPADRPGARGPGPVPPPGRALGHLGARPARPASSRSP